MPRTHYGEENKRLAKLRRVERLAAALGGNRGLRIARDVLDRPIVALSECSLEELRILERDLQAMLRQESRQVCATPGCGNFTPYVGEDYCGPCESKRREQTGGDDGRRP